MKLKTKLLITCLSMILIPLILTFLTFVMVGRYMVVRQYDFRQEIKQEVEQHTNADISMIVTSTAIWISPTLRWLNNLNLSTLAIVSVPPDEYPPI